MSIRWKKPLKTVWQVWLDGSSDRTETYRVYDGDLTVNISARAIVGSVVDARNRDVLFKPLDVIDGKLHVTIDGKLHVLRPGEIHDLHMKYTALGPIGQATVDATWHVRLVSAKREAW